MIGKIGGGAYGQVWLARGVTGAYRAVKIVAREDFPSEKVFEREFEGIKLFEPVSRCHAGLVDILHVGRSYGGGFYFYVMELADDCACGDLPIDPSTYRPRTLQSDMAARRCAGFTVEACARVGMALADALDHLHAHGLTHRDVKPSNVIFVNGTPKLADIGLVAETGERSFVGTEGFVAPEGPGTPQADIYSLGMVLYEMATGNDRLNFPELPDHFHLAREERKRWQRLNEIICRCGVRDLSRRYARAAHIANDLALPAMAEVSPNRVSTNWLQLATLILLCLAAVLWHGRPKTGSIGYHRFDSPDALDDSVPRGPALKETEAASRIPLARQEPVREFTTDKDSLTRLPLGRMPTPGRAWTNSLGMAFQFDEKHHRYVSLWPVSTTDYRRFLEQPGEQDETQWAGVPASQVFPEYIGNIEWVLTTPGQAFAFCHWLTERESEGPTPDLEFGQAYQPIVISVPVDSPAAQSLLLFRCQLRAR